MSLAPSLSDRHTKVRRTSGNLDRWEARYGVTVTQEFDFHGDWHIVTTTARMTFFQGEGDDRHYVELDVERVSTTRHDPEPIAKMDREDARDELAWKFNNWVQVQDELTAMDAYLATEGGAS